MESLPKVMLVSILLLAAFWAVVHHRAGQFETRAEAAHPPEGDILNIDGQKVHVVTRGAGPDLVLIHGSSGNTRDMTHAFAGRLAQSYRVIVIDRPGLGYTDPISKSGASITQQAALLQKAAARLGAQKPIVLGHSYGGAVAMAWAVHHPDNIAALVILSGATKPWATGLTPYYRLVSHPVLGPVAIPLITAFVPDHRIAASIADVFAPQAPPDGYAAHFGPGLSLRRASLRANALQRANLLGEINALHQRYREITVPTEVAHGTADTAVDIGIHAEALAAEIAGARLTRLDGIGHMPHHVAADQVIAVINRAATRAGLRP